MKRVLAGLMLLAVLLPAGVMRSGATFVASTANPGATFAAAGDFNTVAVSLTNPGSPLRGSVAVSATAASDRGLASVVFQSAPAGTGSWTTACTKSVIAPPGRCVAGMKIVCWMGPSRLDRMSPTTPTIVHSTSSLPLA